MTTRRRFVRSLFAATVTLPALKNDGVTHILRTARAVDDRDPAAVAEDEDFWREIQRAFDIDRGLINLNNGGGAPSPRGVQEAMPPHLAVFNHAPAGTLWAGVEPRSEAGRGPPPPRLPGG